MVLMNTRLARHAQSHCSSLALCFGLVLALSTTATGSASAQAPAAKNSPAKSSALSGAQEDEDDEKDERDDDKADPGKGGADAAERLVRRRERLEQGAKRLRDRAADLRKRIAAGETTAPQSPNAKRPPRSLQEQAERFEKQAERMETRSKNLTAESAGGGGAERSPEYARQRRHQLRRAHLNRRWGGPTLRDPEAVAEFKTHSERVARLKRIRSLAMEKGKDDPLAKRAKELLSKEEDRHEQHMKTIQSRVAPEGAGAADPAAAATNPTTTTTPAPAATEESK
ncbi:MAG: hypothetical protein RL685_3123 [Pseudomonadota bacterium]|jgi:hypothetical protein